MSSLTPRPTSRARPPLVSHQTSPYIGQQQSPPPTLHGHNRTSSHPATNRPSSFSDDSSVTSPSSKTPSTMPSNTPVSASQIGQAQTTNTPPKPLPNPPAGATASTTNLSSTAVSRSDLPPRGSSAQANSMNTAAFNYGNRDTRARQHSQGFFEPSLPHAQQAHTQLTASQIAAQAAMHAQSPRGQQQAQAPPGQNQHDRKRSQTVPEQPSGSKNSSSASTPKDASAAQSKSRPGYFPPPIHITESGRSSPHLNQRKDGGNKNVTAASAASAAYPPRSPLNSPSLQNLADYTTSPASERGEAPTIASRFPGKEKDKDKDKDKEKTKRKLFSKPSRIHISKDKDADKKTIQTAGIYGTHGTLPLFNQSTSSLADLPTPPSIYSNTNANSSTSTLVPMERAFTGVQEKEKHRHHFLSRQKNKPKDDHHNLQLSSASSNSRPIDPAMPQPLYSFAPSSPGLGNKSITGFDLRHGGRGLREKKKEEKAAASSFVPPGGTPILESSAFRDREHAPLVDWAGPPSLSGAAGTASTGLGLGMTSDLGIPTPGLASFGLQNMGADDAWPLLRARLLNIFEGEDLRTPVEDFNRLVSIHLQRCVQRRTPGMILDDLRDLLQTGFLSLDQTLRGIQEERLVPHLVEIWSFAFGTVLPFMQAVFLPLDLEFKGHGILLSSKEAAEFWASASHSNTVKRPTTSTSVTHFNPPAAARAPPKTPLDVRAIVLHAFRDTVVLPRHDTLLAIFSRLSLESIYVSISRPSFDLPPLDPPGLLRPGTASSGSAPNALDPSSYNSQGSTLLDSSTADSLDARSRATSNTSAGSFHSAGSGRGSSAAHVGSLPKGGAGATIGVVGGQAGFSTAVVDSAKVTETAARMLQCVSVLAGLGAGAGAGKAASGEEANEDPELGARKKMERLGKELKLNWLGRGRTGRNRRGLVGTKVRPIGVGA